MAERRPTEPICTTWWGEAEQVEGTTSHGSRVTTDIIQQHACHLKLDHPGPCQCRGCDSELGERGRGRA